MAKRNPVSYKIIVPEDFFSFLDAAIEHAQRTRGVKVSRRRMCIASGLSHATIWEAEKSKRDLKFSTIIRCCTVLGYEMKLVRLPPPQSVIDYDEAIRERPGKRKTKPRGGVNFFKKKSAPPVEEGRDDGLNLERDDGLNQGPGAGAVRTRPS